MPISARLLSLALALAFSTACDGGARTDATAVASSEAPVSGDTVVAEFDGRKVTLAELDASIAGQLSEVRQQEYDLRREGLSRLVEDHFIEKEAAARGISKEALRKAEVDDKVGAPPAGDLAALYEQYRGRFAGRTREEAIEVIRTSMLRQMRAEREREWRGELRRKADVEMALQAPRTEVTVPAEAPSRGPGDAPVTMVEFLDYGCGYCKRAHGTVEELLKKYEGKIRFVHRDYPLNPEGPTVNAARAVHCAGDQSRFWEYHADLLVNPGTFDHDDLARRAGQIGLDAGAFKSCLASGRHDEAIARSAEAASDLGVNSTPTFFINGRKVSGARPIDDFVTVIDEELARSGRS